ncbi:MAG: hypothetical protein JW840_00770 [Candidatus Thermoplasmatota archaeon]|nr:hypothetical protein [Candidatus Thermoplasmatota archaeon]
MTRQCKRISYLFVFLMVFSGLLIPLGQSCKDIVVSSAATAGDYSLLLKVRDPSRDGLQVLCRVPKGTTYSYHHPWTGKPWEFLVTHTFIGVATQGDTLPNIVKAGMVLTDAGLAFGDADTRSGWVNPTKNAWDDFDWIRYACQSVQNEEEAITALTTEAVDQLHATGVSENLFVIGPQKAVVIEADALRYTRKNISTVAVMSNYAKDLWRTQFIKSLPVASSFDLQKETGVRRGVILRLGSFCGVRIIQITPSALTVKLFPSFVFTQSGLETEYSIPLGERVTVGPYSMRLLEINETTAKISLCTAAFAWEQKIHSIIDPVIGNITIQHMMDWSRLHPEDLDNLRPLCEDQVTYEAVMIWKIPTEQANFLSSGWFAANHACSSIYVPVHICDEEFYEAYETGEAANLSLSLLQKYGHGNITALCQSVETVFLAENQGNELLAYEMIQHSMNITPFMTAVDMAMQEQAFLTQQLWFSAPNTTRNLIEHLWMENYSVSLFHMQQAMLPLSQIPGSSGMLVTLTKIIQSIRQSQVKREAFQVGLPSIGDE